MSNSVLDPKSLSTILPKLDPNFDLNNDYSSRTMNLNGVGSRGWIMGNSGEDLHLVFLGKDKLHDDSFSYYDKILGRPIYQFRFVCLFEDSTLKFYIYVNSKERADKIRNVITNFLMNYSKGSFVNRVEIFYYTGHRLIHECYKRHFKL